MLAAARWLQGNSSGLGKGGRCAILAAFILFSAFNMGERSWNTFHPFVINDIVTTIYAQYARNLVRYPLSETRGLMVDLVGAPPSGLTLGEPTTVYTDHPSGTVWLIAVVHRFLVNDPIMAARLTNIIAAIGTGVVILAFVYRRTSLWPAVGATIVLLTLPLFWEHSIVANFKPVTLFFMVAATTSFVRYREQPGYGRLVATVLLWIGGMLCDWPAYFLGAPFAAALIYRRQWGLLVLFTALGFGTMGAVFGQLMLGPAAFSPTGLFYGTHSALLTEPFGLSMSCAFGFVVRGFALWRCWLALPFVPIVWRGNASARMNELQFLFLSFLFVGVANDMLFYSWAGEHSFWSYYLIPVVCFGAALSIQWLSDRAFESPWIDMAFRAGVIALFAIATISCNAATRGLTKLHFSKPPSFAELLGEHHLADMLAPASVILIGPYCGHSHPPKDGAIRWPDDMPRCDIFKGQGSKAPYWFDRPAVPASEFDPGRMSCQTSYLVLKGANSAQLLARLSLTATEVPWLEWFVLRLSDLPAAYCERPARLFEEIRGLEGEGGLQNSSRP